jgi:hypothetical protein
VLKEIEEVSKELTSCGKNLYSDNKEEKSKFDVYPPCPKINCTPAELEHIAEKIHPTKVVGFDNIPLTILKEKKAQPLLLSTVNGALSEICPDPQLFATRIIFLNKKADQTPTPTTVRPIALTNTIQKIIEHMLLHRLSAETQGYFNKAQMGFVKEKETLMHIIRMFDRVDTIKSTNDNLGYMLFIDFKSAFDMIENDILI